MGRILPVILFFILQALWLQGQSVTTEFGKNRIQYHDDFDVWDMYESPNFITYWYGKGREIAHTVVQLAELDNPSIQNILEHKMNDKIELIIYIDLTDMKQSNLGIEEQFVGKGGITKVIENKIFLYFNGDHNALRKQLREGIAEVYINSMLHGNNLQEVVQNAVLLNLPDWFQEGLISYVGDTWSPEIDSRLNDYFTNPKNKKKDFSRLTKMDPRLAGHSMWNYLANTYGHASISNILYLTRINRSLENGLLYVLGINSKELAVLWKEYYEKRFLASAQTATKPFSNDLQLTNTKHPLPLGRMRLSPDSKKLAYTIHDNGRVRVMLYDMESGDKKVLYRYGIRNYEQETDLNYPVISWRQDGKELSIVYERKDVVSLMKIDFEQGISITDKLGPEYHRVYDLDYWSSDTLVLSATTDGFSDLYLYIPKTRQSQRITEDFYDDLDASVITLDQKRYILFSSNRPNETLRKMQLDSILPIGPSDLYLLDYAGTKSTLRRLTFSPDASERKARLSDTETLVCLADFSGRWQRVQVSRLLDDPPVSMLFTEYDRDIILHEVVPGSPVIIDWLQKYDKPYFHISRMDSSDVSENTSPISRESANELLAKLSEKTNVQQKVKQEEDLDPKYFFQTPFPVVKTEPVIKETPKPSVEESAPSTSIPTIVQPTRPDNPKYSPGDLTPFIRTRIIASRLKFKLDYFNITMDNDLLFGGLDSYAGQKREFEPSQLGILCKASVKDLLEDYVITGGARFPTSFNGSEYFLVFDNRKRRVDKEFAVYRKAVTESDPTDNDPSHKNQYVSFLALGKWSYPFDTYNSLRMSTTLRNDRTIALSTDKQTLDTDTDDAQRFGLKLEWVYDNTRLLDLNTRTGTRIKTSVEVVKRFDLNLFESDKKFQFNKGFMTVLGLDARHYVSLDRRSIFAARLTAASSFGSERILYYLGGVENWLFPAYDNSVAVPNDINFAYTALAANMRGFKYNARNGSSVVLANAELRVPIFQYLSRQKIRSSFIRNIQLVPFIDAGTAWHGPSPFGSGNPLNTVVLTNPPTVEVIVNYYRNPLIIGYGIGARTMVFGYYLKLDYGWAWETKTSRDPLLQFSMGADF